MQATFPGRANAGTLDGMQSPRYEAVFTLAALFIFGYIKGRFTTARPFRSGWQTVVVGGLAATAAFVIAKAIG